jgi:hypothetical protein
MRIIGADERLRERRGAKVLIIGPFGIGKTSLLRTLTNLDRVLFVDIEAGDLSVIDVEVPTIRLDDWATARDLACRIGGPSPSFPPTACYSQAHYEAIGGALEGLDHIDTLFVDSLTAVSRLSFRHSETMPEAYSEKTGRKDLRGAYGLHGREMLLWLNQLQHARALNVVFVGLLEYQTDDFNRGIWQLQCEAPRPAASCPELSMRSSATRSWTTATANRRSAASCARRRTAGIIPPKIDQESLTRSSRPTWGGCFTS